MNASRCAALMFDDEEEETTDAIHFGGKRGETVDEDVDDMPSTAAGTEKLAKFTRKHLISSFQCEEMYTYLMDPKTAYQLLRCVYNSRFFQSETELHETIFEMYAALCPRNDTYLDKETFEQQFYARTWVEFVRSRKNVTSFEDWRTARMYFKCTYLLENAIQIKVPDSMHPFVDLRSCSLEIDKAQNVGLLLDDFLYQTITPMVVPSGADMNDEESWREPYYETANSARFDFVNFFFLKASRTLNEIIQEDEENRDMAAVNMAKIKTFLIAMNETQKIHIDFSNIFDFFHDASVWPHSTTFYCLHGVIFLVFSVTGRPTTPVIFGPFLDATDAIIVWLCQFSLKYPDKNLQSLWLQMSQMTLQPFWTELCNRVKSAIGVSS